MKSTDLQKLGEAAQQALDILLSAGEPIRNQSFLALTSEAQCTYLADCRASYLQSVNILSELSRQCHTAVRLWQTLESDESRLIGVDELSILNSLYNGNS